MQTFFASNDEYNNAENNENKINDSLIISEKDIDKLVAIDVEHTKVYDSNGHIRSVPTQLSIVDHKGNILLNEYFILEGKPLVKPSKRRVALNIQKKIKRIPYSTIKPHVIELLKNKIIVGHDLIHDFDALGLKMYNYKRIDTAKIPFFMKRPEAQPRQLKMLVEQYLGREIQSNIHDALIDARASMNLFQEFRKGNFLKFQYPQINIEYSKKVLEEAKKHGLNTEKYTGPNLIEFPRPQPKNYSEELSQLYTVKPSGKPNLIAEHMRNLQVETNKNLINLNTVNNTTRKNLKYEKNLEGLFQVKQKTPWQKFKNYFTRKTRKNRK
jgi:hypothetical protein